MTCKRYCKHQPCPSPYECLSTTDGGATVEDGVPIQFIGPEPQPSAWPFLAIAAIAVVSFLAWVVR